MNNDDHNQLEKAARRALDDHLDKLPEDITSALAAARKKALESAAAGESAQPTAKIYSFNRRQMAWSGAIAASVTALALTLALQPPGADTPLEADYLLTLAELEDLDDTEWALVQDLEFALWLSTEGLSTEGLSTEGLNELGDEAFATEPQS
jgi:hypothetical protein